MSRDKIVAHLSNIATVAAIAWIMTFVMDHAQADAKWLGTFLGTGLGGLVGYLKGISTK